MAGEWNGVPFQPHTLKIAGSTPVPAMIMQNGSTGKAAPSYGVTGRFESGFCNRVSITDIVYDGKTIIISSRKQSGKRSITTMTYTMTCKQHREEEKRFWFCQERGFLMPVSEKQIMSITGRFQVDT